MLYNIDSLVSAQVNFLTAEKARLYKSASIGTKQDDSTYTPIDTSAWKNELEIFTQLNVINRPSYKGNYLIHDGLFDPSSNLTVKAYSSTKDLPVKYLRIFYQESLQKPRKIEALYNDKNEMYTSARLLSMEFRQLNNKSILTSYSVQGGQHMILSDSVSFLIKGKIIID